MSPSLVMSADALLLVDQRRPEVLDYQRLSVSTKVPQYLRGSCGNKPCYGAAESGKSS